MELDNITVFKHNSIRIEGSKKIYIDPFRIDEKYNDADYIFCTHSHYDHYSEEDISNLLKKDTKLIVTKDIYKKAVEFLNDECRVYSVEQNKEYNIDGLYFKTIPAYNINKQFHPIDNEWVGYIIELDNVKYYIAGDTDNVPEIRNIKCDVAFIPVGGTYTMNVEEAADLANKINAKCIVPTHYGEIVGNKNDGNEFKKLVNKEVHILIK
ncbi:MAG: MBL fold metallo-hydrolase [Clostridiales bacterium]|nr:MBL fold metallo-hydrolase [Clostridiales bacterium]